MLLLIGGHPRSGTTLLQQLCHSHPAMAVTNEFGNLAFAGQPYRTYAREMIGRWRNVGQGWAYNPDYAHAAGWVRQNNFGFTAVHLMRLRWQVRGAVTLADIETIMRGVFPQAQIVGDKWPRYLYLIDQFVNEPELRRLIIYRDCRDVTSSFLRQARTNWRDKPWIGRLDSADKIARRWVQGIEISEKYAKYLHIMRYENLMRQPQRELAALGDWLGVDPDGFPTDMVDPSNIGKHQQGLTAEELETVMRIAGPTMARLGYV